MPRPARNTDVICYSVAPDRAAEAAAGLVVHGFSSSNEAYKAVQKYFAASPVPGRLLVSCYPAAESPVQALDMHIASLDKPAMLFMTLSGSLESVVITVNVRV